MSAQKIKKERFLRRLLVGAICFGATIVSHAAQREPGTSPRAIAPKDFTGYWVALITEDWRFRMMTPPVGDVESVPLNPEGIRVANAWNVAADVAAGEQCRAFGAAGIMRMPTRLHITWQDDAVLKIETDNGQQVRLLNFAENAQATAADWQGFTRARWETMVEGQRYRPLSGVQVTGSVGLREGLSGSLHAVTTNMRPGYLRRNGVPYSGEAMLTEYFDRSDAEGGDSWLTVLSIVEDRQYLAMPYLVTSHFKREPDGSKFHPRPCEVVAPTVASPPRQ